LLQSCTVLLTVPFVTFFGGAELALKGRDLYNQMKRADGRRAFELPFEETWDNTLQVLNDLSLETNKAGKNKEGDGGVVEAKSRDAEIRIAVVKLTEKVSEVGIWAKRDQPLAALILDKISEETERSLGVLKSRGTGRPRVLSREKFTPTLSPEY
ncbi:MAG TPA: hypothetical protein VN648_31920, partial [Candidatus Methylomirabilis sp.]|nr:hypothetical protein [Candidatus Methylomirabilis sp.]